MNPPDAADLKWLEKRLYEDRVYEGEWIFVCTPPCPGYIVEYAFTGWDDEIIASFLSNLTGGHALYNCPICGEVLQWTGYPLQLPITQSLIDLLQGNHFMASIIVIAAIIDNSISNLMWATFIDSGLDIHSANELVKTRIARSDALNMIRSLTDWHIEDIVFPARNLVAHGKGFTIDERFYRDELIKEISDIRRWIEMIYQEVHPTGFTPGETHRWLLFMDHWSLWLTNFIQSGNLADWKDSAGSPTAFTALATLIDGRHYMVSTVILAAIVEGMLNELLRTFVIDRGMGEKQANNLINGNLGRAAILQTIRSISTRSIKDIVFPSRNLVAHGKGFAKGNAFYQSELMKQIDIVSAWIEHTSKEITAIGSIGDRSNNWLSSMGDLSNQLASLIPRPSDAS
jgi:hypothetical protein